VKVKLCLEKEMQGISTELGLKDEGLAFKFCERVHESIENRKAIGLLVIQFQIVKMKLCLER
jgi:hypothetical protein